MIDLVDWSVVENALQVELARGLDLTGDRVRWSKPSGDAPVTAGDYAVIAIEGNTSLAPATPEQRIETNPVATPGAEILISSVEPVEFTLVVDVFSMRREGNHSAFARANRARSALGLESTTATLEAAGLAVVQTEGVQSIPALLETEYQGRARFNALIRVSGGSQESATYIETAEWVSSLT